MDAPVQKKVRIDSVNYAPGKGSLTISGLTEEEVRRFEGALRGQWWMVGDDGRLRFEPARKPTPAPAEDPMLPQWREHVVSEEGEPRYHLSLFGEGDPDTQTSSIIIQHLCGYNYTPESYKETAEFLEECGFSCLRSRRGDDGRFWEIWFLPGLWAAKARLRETLYGEPKTEHLRAALKFLAERAPFGTLDVAVQRLCQVIE